MEIFLNVLQFVAVVAVMGLVAHFLLKKFAKEMHDKIDAKLDEVLSMFKK